ncbi:MAG: PIN domain-containing protein [Candidatus Methanoperedens sp.]|nr:PIN domain-containing protein [Candidatus Methanoperedens sp.]MCZ7405761.1 PIN domain-containing protein [Candidatus Methanoperedens sp.]
MKLVLDSNIIFSALIKKSTTRNIILSDVFELHAPEYIFSEITKHKELLLKKSKMNEGDFDALLLLLQKHIQLVQKEKYNEKMAPAEDILKDIDVTDSPFLALALALNCKIWSNDRHFKQQDKVGACTTKELTKTINI